MPGHSLCWKFITRLPDRRAVECNICKHLMNYSGGSTSNLIRHIKVKHPIELDLELKKHSDEKAAISFMRTTPSEAAAAVKQEAALSQSLTKYMPDSNKKRQLDEAILDLIVIDMQPLSIVEQRGFKNLVHKLDTKYKIVTKQRLTEQLLPDRYTTMKRIVIDELSLVKHVCITTDCWTSASRESKGKEAFVTVTAHFITLDWELKSRVLSTFLESEGKQLSPDNLALELQQTFKEFSIHEKVTTIVTDNTEIISNAVYKTGIAHLPCFAHTLNLTVCESIKAVERFNFILKKVRDIATYFHSSSVSTNSLKEVHSSRKGTFIKLNLDVETRWNSTFEMLKSYLVQHDEVTTVLCLSGNMELCLKEIEVTEAKEAMEVLEPFYEATVELSSEKSTLASKIIPLVKSLKRITARGSSTLSQALSRSLNYRHTAYESDLNLRLATLLDPRFKAAGFSSSEIADSTVALLKEEMKKVSLPSEPKQDPYDDFRFKPPPAKRASLLWTEFDEEAASATRHLAETYVVEASPSYNYNQVVIAPPPPPPPPKNTNTSLLWNEFDEEAATEQISTVDMEVRQYLSGHGIRRDKDPMIWWGEQQKVLPLMELVANKVHATPATSVPCEHIFSKMGELVSMRRAQLKKNHVDMILFLNKNEYKM